jgi:phage terminase large subunit-like protein
MPYRRMAGAEEQGGEPPPLAGAGAVVCHRMAANVAVAQDPASNLKLAKNKSTERIDGVIALIMAIGRALVAQEELQPMYQIHFV